MIRTRDSIETPRASAPEKKRPADGAFQILLKGSRLRGRKPSGTLLAHLGIAALVIPLVDDKIELLDVALAVVSDLADHGVPGAGLDGVHHLLRIRGSSLGGGLRPDLHGRIGIERVALGIDVLGLELLDDRGRGRLLARVGTEGEERAPA